MKKLTRSLICGSIGAMALAAVPALADGVWVLNNSDAGDGSFRAAILEANADPSVTWIKFKPNIGTVALTAPVEFTGSQPMSIDGGGASLTVAPGTPVFDLVVATGGSPLDLVDLEFAGGVNGLVVAGSMTLANDLVVCLSKVAFAGNAEFGLLINDGGSAGGVRVVLQRCDFTGNGAGSPDRDGLRVNESDAGGIVAVLKECILDVNGGDGAEFDEDGDGDVSLTLLHSIVELNGFQDPTDLEDGIDIDEADAGNVYVLVVDLELNRNKQQGLDLNEAGPGSQYVALTQVTAAENGKEAIKVSEEDEGDLAAGIHNAAVDKNGDDGVQAKEAADGNLSVTVVNSEITRSKKYGVNVEQEAPGDGVLRLLHTLLNENKSGPVDNPGVDIVIVRGEP